MSSLSTKLNENFDNNIEEASVLFPSNKKKNYKCNLKNTFGIITPKVIDSFATNSSTEESNHIQNNFYINNVIKINIVENSKIIWSKNPFSTIDNDDKEIKYNNNENNDANIFHFKATQDFIRTINRDSIETIVPCKPMLNSTASKSYMQEYSKSKKYQEDLKNLPYENYRNSKFFEKNSNNEDKSSKNSLFSVINEEKEKEENSINDIQELIEFQERNLPVPIKEKDNENFKILTMKKMKRKTMPPNKSVRKFAEDKEPYYEKEFRITNSFCKLMKKKVVHSTRRLYSSNFVLGNGKKKVEFKIFRDKDIGVYEYWQAHIHEAQNDEDVETDEEQKALAKCFTLGEIKEAFNFIKNKSYEDAFVNFNRYERFRTKEENENIQKELLNLKRKIDL